MKFRFCGEQDAPDWILAEVSVLSKMSSVRMKLICRQIINQLLGIGINYDKLTKLTQSSRIHFDVDELKAMVAALHFIFANAAKYDVDPAQVLPMELQQLGLPRDICTAIVRAFQGAKEAIRDRLRQDVLRLPRLHSIDWRVDYVLASSFLANADTPNVRMQLHIRPPPLSSTALSAPPPPEQKVAFALTPAQFTLLYNDLKQARQLLQHV